MTAPNARADMTAAEIATRLTKARRTALWNMHTDDGWDLAPHDGWRRAGLACAGLCDQGLAQRSTINGAWHYRLTPLGLTVRAALTNGD
jgi:hypothetical protein